MSEELEREVKLDVYFGLLFCTPTDANTNFGSDIQTNNEYLRKTIDNLSNVAKVGGDKAGTNKLSINRKDTDKIKLNLPKLAAYQLTATGVTVCSDTPYQCSYTDKSYCSYHVRPICNSQQRDVWR